MENRSRKLELIKKFWLLNGPEKFYRKMREKIGIVSAKILGRKISMKNSSPKIYRKNLRCMCAFTAVV